MDKDKDIWKVGFMMTAARSHHFQFWSLRDFFFHSEAFLNHELDDLDLNTEITLLSSQMITL
jgi:hypothetical protein